MRIGNFLIKLSIILSLLVAGVYCTSCSEKDNEPTEEPVPPQEDPQPEEESGLKPGDDFYTYVNAEWLESLKDADPNEFYGWQIELFDVAEENLDAVKDEMPEYAILREDLDKCEENLEASTQLVVDIVTNMLGNIKTKEDAYVAYGKAIRMGISSIATMYLGICRDDNTFGFFFLPPSDGSEDGGAAKQAKRRSDVIATKKYDRYTPSTRSGKSTIDYVLEGIGFDPKYYLYDKTSEQTVAMLEEMSLSDLVNTISKAVQVDLLMYCADEYVVANTGGGFESISDYLAQTLEKDLDYFTSYYFTQKYITKDVQNVFRERGLNLVNTFRKRLENNAWLSPATKQAAIEKLDNMTMDYGAPIKWPVTEMPELEGELLLADVLKIKECRINVIESLMGEYYEGYLPIYAMLSIEKGEFIYLYEVNAIYSTTLNGFIVLAPFMMEPAYSKDMDLCEFYASLGVTIGHEITHGFDNEGACYDKYGEMNNWWTEADMAKFTELNNLVINNINTYEVIPGLKANGALTVPEDVADLGGFNIAYDYWVDYLTKQGVKGAELIEKKKQFFISYAKMYAMKYPDDYVVQMVATDVHSIGHIRINSVVQQIDDWYELFGVKEGDALYLAPEKRITIW